MPNNLVLISSNYRKEYILDILEVIAKPKGFVQNFRFKNSYLSNDLLGILNGESDELDDILKNIKVVIYYLHQSTNGNNISWGNLTPIRFGYLVRAFKTGDNMNDVSHFYFEMGEYIDYRALNNAVRAQWVIERRFSFLEDENTLNLTSIDSFYLFCSNLQPNINFAKPDGTLYHDPIYINILGLKDKFGEIVKPEYNQISRKSFYELVDGTENIIEFSTYTHSNNGGHYSISLKTDEKVFVTPGEREFDVNSRYDNNSYELNTSLIEANLKSVMYLSTQSLDSSPSEKLNISVEIPVFVKRKKAPRIVNLLGDVFFGLGTATIAVAKLRENQPWPDWIPEHIRIYIEWPSLMIAFYTLWITFKIIAMVLRGK